MPFEHDIKGDGALSAVGDIGSTKHLPPSLLLQFYPLEKSTSLMPYVGIGWNYTLFFEEDTNDEFTSAVAGIINTPLARTTLELDDSDGVAFELGADWRISDQFAVNTSVWYLDIDTTARIDAVTTGGEVIKDAARFDVEIDPLVYSVGAAFKF
jgi:outer membrane protein